MAGRSCTVCSHPDRAAIDKLLVSGSSSIRRIATRHGLDPSSVQRHKKSDLPTSLVRRTELVTERREESLGEEVRRKKAEAEALQGKATQEGDYRTALMAIKAWSDLVELLIGAAAIAQAQEAGQVTVTFRIAEDVP